MIKVKLSGTVPVVQYGNLIPEVEVEGETYEQAMAEAESYIRTFWNKYVETGKELPDGNSKRLDAFCGGQIDYVEVAHVYTWEGTTYLSGSQYAESFRKPFDKQKIAGLMADKIKGNPADIIKMWELKGQASKDFGNSIHKALQLYEQYRELCKALGKETNLHDNFVLKDVVESFFKDREAEKAESEIVVVDHAAKRAGQIDRLVILGEKHGRVEDFKTGEVSKNLSIYMKQLEFYSDIMVAGGWKMDKPVIHGWNGSWKEYK